ncbi:MAG: hypothetical protein ACUZ8O_14535 [Candidatus Anammoxibacter sp.]
MEEKIQNSSEPDTQQTPNTDSNNSSNEIEEESVTGRDTVLKRYHKLSQKGNKKGQKRIEDNLFTIIVIAYTILLLVLGFFVYRDLSKRLSNIEDRISTIETLMIRNQNITIDNIKVYDAE